MGIFLIAGGAGVVLLLVLSRGSKTQVGAKNSGIGGANKLTSGVKAFPVGTIADSLSKIGTSIFGGSGTHSPTDPTIKSAGATGDPMKTAVFTLDGPKSPVPDSHEIVTQLDAAPSTATDDQPLVTMDDYTVADYGD